MRKTLIVAACCLALMAVPALAQPTIDLPAGVINFNGNGVFDQTPVGTFNPETGLPNPAVPGTEIFGVGTISDAELVGLEGASVWLPTDVSPTFEMTYSLWDAVVTDSGSAVDPGTGLYNITARYADDARLVLVGDTSKDYNPAPGPGPFDLATGFYPTAYTLPGPSPDPDEFLYLELALGGSTSVITFDPTRGIFTAAQFTANEVTVIGGEAADEFSGFSEDSLAGGNAFIWRFSPTGWGFGGNTDLRVVRGEAPPPPVIPEPAALISLFSGLALLGGYRLRRRA